MSVRPPWLTQPLRDLTLRELGNMPSAVDQASARSPLGVLGRDGDAPGPLISGTHLALGT
ncbi:hypothetical protein PSCLAVI8L_320090 [Pseudoclavibacter sp. 8L]|nr:hypothetical protein PSCLAVI8L_320090 [Pseudoclavibacter sp. 8L]